MPRQFDQLQHEVITLYSQGEYGRALEIVLSGLDDFLDNRSRMTFWAACLECKLNRPAQALKRLQSLINDGEWVSPLRLKNDDDLAPLRELTELEELIAVCEDRRTREQAKVVPELKFKGPLGESTDRSLPPLIVALHMMGGTIDEVEANWSSVRGLGWALAIPQGTELMGPREFGWSNRTKEQLGRQLEDLQQAEAFDADQVVFGGTSRGAAHAVEMAVSGLPLQARGFIAIVGAPPVEALPADLTEAREAGVRGVFITGDQDYALPRVRAAYELLERAGLPVRLEVLSGLGHAYPPEISEHVRRGLDFIVRDTKAYS